MQIALGKKALLYRRFTAAVVFAAVFSTVVLALGRYFLLSFCVCLALTLLFSVLLFFYIPLLVRSTDLSVQNGYICCKKGVIIRREYYYPNVSVQYVQSLRLPICSCFGLVIPIVRGTGHSLILPELDLDGWITFINAVNSHEQ